MLGPDLSTSILIVQRLMDGAMPGCPRLSFGLVDVRDVADLHLRAMTHPAAKGERFLAIAGSFVSMQEIAQVLKARLGEAARRVPTRTLPNWLVRLVGLFDPAVATIVPELGKVKNATSEKARRVLGWATAIQRGRHRRHRGEPDAARAAGSFESGGVTRLPARLVGGAPRTRTRIDPALTLRAE